MTLRLPIVLSIAGSDCSGGAGIQADIKTITALNGYAATAITALTAQNTQGVQAVSYASPELISQQLQAIFEDLDVDAVKIGMTGASDVIHAIADALQQHPCRHVVFDPVMVSTSGHKLTEDDAIETACHRLMPHATLVTPNLNEAMVLLNDTIRTVEEMKAAARALRERYHTAFLIKGGHLAEGEMCDVLCDREGGIHLFSQPRIKTKNLHGTGCTLSSAIATLLAQGRSYTEAINEAKAFLTALLVSGTAFAPIGQGHGPLLHTLGNRTFGHTPAETNRP